MCVCQKPVAFLTVEVATTGSMCMPTSVHSYRCGHGLHVSQDPVLSECTCAPEAWGSLNGGSCNHGSWCVPMSVHLYRHGCGSGVLQVPVLSMHKQHLLSSNIAIIRLTGGLEVLEMSWILHRPWGPAPDSSKPPCDTCGAPTNFFLHWHLFYTKWVWSFFFFFQKSQMWLHHSLGVL